MYVLCMHVFALCNSPVFICKVQNSHPVFDAFRKYFLSHNIVNVCLVNAETMLNINTHSLNISVKCCLLSKVPHLSAQIILAIVMTDCTSMCIHDLRDRDISIYKPTHIIYIIIIIIYNNYT